MVILFCLNSYDANICQCLTYKITIISNVLLLKLNMVLSKKKKNVFIIEKKKIVQFMQVQRIM